MSVKTIRTISAILLATLVLVSSTSFVVGIHVCMGEISDVALLTKATKCAMETNVPPCHRKMKSSCCEDETIIHNAGDVKASLTQIHVPDLAATTIDQPLVLISEIIPSTPGAHTRFYHYDPPLRSFDLTVEHQSFII